MNEDDLKHFKEKLEKALQETEGHLKNVARRNPDNPNDWEPVPDDMDSTGADKNEFADSIEEFETNTAVTKHLEIRYNNIKGALQRIEDGVYGYCTEGEKHEIERERLEAEPSADTCLKHK